MLSLLLRRRALMGAVNRVLSNPPLVIDYEGYRLDGIRIVADDTRNITEYYAVQGGDTVAYLINGITTADGAFLGLLCVYRTNYNYDDFYNLYNNRAKTIRIGTANRYMRMTVPNDCEADSYAYNQTTGVIYFAGINTPYYGKTNIND